MLHLLLIESVSFYYLALLPGSCICNYLSTITETTSTFGYCERLRLLLLSTKFAKRVPLLFQMGAAAISNVMFFWIVGILLYQHYSVSFMFKYLLKLLFATFIPYLAIFIAVLLWTTYCVHISSAIDWCVFILLLRNTMFFSYN